MTNKSLISRLLLLMAFIFGGLATPCAFAEEHNGEDKLDVKEIIFEHLGDGYGWEVPFVHQYRIPLPVIVKANDGSWHCFSSSRLTELIETEDMNTGKKQHHLVSVPVYVKKGDKDYTFYLSKSEKNKNKVVQLLPAADADATIDKTDEKNNLPEFVDVEGVKYTEYKPFDISITKNVLALIIAAVVVTLMMMSVVRWYRRNGMKAPRKGTAFLEMLVEFIYDGVIKNTLGKRAPKYAPYLLTAFFFILVMNLLGLIVIFPGGANLTGNIAITIVLAVLTFIVTNINGNKQYWKEIFWPDVPLFLKFPLPIMQFIEIFGIFTKPAALCVRLFANMMGGHMIVITLILLIFIFAAFGAAVASGVTVVSLLFSIFMLLLDVLVSFIQAYVFTMLSTIFISLSTDEHEEHAAHKEEIRTPEISVSSETKTA